VQLIFHPVDTISKRLMSNKAQVRRRSLVRRTTSISYFGQLTASTLNAVIFREHANKAAGGKFLSLFPGLGYAAGYSAYRTRVPHTRLMCA
jgi:hypothetical protein